MLRRTVNWLYDSLNCTDFTAVAHRLLFYKGTRKGFTSHLSSVADDRFKPLVGKQKGKTMAKGKLWSKTYLFSGI